MKVSKLKCLFCEDVIHFVDESIQEFLVHLEIDHMISPPRKHLVLAISFLTEDEIEEVSSKMVSRLETFLQNGAVTDTGQNSFDNTSDIDDDDDEVMIIEERLNDNEVANIEIKKEPTSLSLKPCKIMLKRSVPGDKIADVLYDAASDDDDDDEYSDLDKHEKTMLFTNDKKKSVNFEDDAYNDQIIESMADNDLDADDMEIEIDIEDTFKQERNIASQDLKSINLVAKFIELNQCRLCFFQASDSQQLKNHEKDQHEDHQDELRISFFTLKDLAFSCKHCVQIPGFLSENVLNYHKRVEHRIKVKDTVVRCKVCQKLVKSSSLKNHRLVHSEKTFECNLCYKKFARTRYLQDHQKSRHPYEAEFHNKNLEDSDLVFSCEECSLRFLTQNVLDYHQKTHERKAIFYCYFCASSFADPKFLRLHCGKVHGKKVNIDTSDKKFKCKLCYTGFNRVKDMNTHSKIHKEDQDALKRQLTEEDLKVICSECDYRFVSFDILKYHINKNHKHNEFEELRKPSFDQENKNYFCKLCYTRFEQFSSLHSHLTLNHENVDKLLLKTTIITESDLKHPCDECDLKFVSTSVLEYHKNKVHVKKEKFVECKICHKVVKRHSFKQHRLTHTSVRDVKCQLCYVTLKTSRILKDHQKNLHASEIEQEFILSGNGPENFQHSCETCDLKFLTRDLLLNHGKSHKLKKFSCQYCPGLFFKFNLYKKHLFEVHKRKISKEKNEKEYQCKLCYRTFVYKRSLQDHLKKVHEQDLDKLLKPILSSDLIFECDKCSLKFLSSNILKYHDEKSHNLSKKKSSSKIIKENIKECKLCYVKFKKNSYLLSHQKNKHKNESEFLEKEITSSDLVHNCNQCEKKFVAASLLKSHSNQHKTESFEFLRKEVFDNKDKIFRCKLCYLEVKYFRDLVGHLSRFHRDDTELLKQDIQAKDLVHECSECDLKFVNEVFLDLHNFKNHTSGDSNTYCKLCCVNFKTDNGFLLHRFTIHKNELTAFQKDYEEHDMMYNCMHCEKKCATEQSLNYHMARTHSKSNPIKKVKNREMYCQLCYVLYKDPKYLRLHKKKVHAEEMDAFDRVLTDEDLEYNCKACDKRFYSHNTLSFHLQRKHKNTSGGNDFYCKLCYISFPYNSALQKHLKILHMSEMHLLDENIDESALVHDCNLCEKKFIREHILRYHQKYQHKDQIDRTTYCKLCQDDFKVSKQFRAHKERIHTTNEELIAFNVKIEVSSLVHKCKFCSKRFLTRNILRYHNIQKHKEERRREMTCQFCNQVFKWTRDRNRVMANHMRNKHEVIDFEADELEPVNKETETVKNFMFLLNSLK